MALFKKALKTGKEERCLIIHTQLDDELTCDQVFFLVRKKRERKRMPDRRLMMSQWGGVN